MDDLRTLQDCLEMLDKQQEMLDLLEEQQDEIDRLAGQVGELQQALSESRETLDESMSLNGSFAGENQRLIRSLRQSEKQRQRLQTQIERLKTLHE